MTAKKIKKRDDVHTISLTVANKPGVLVRIALAFARRGYNIDSLVVSPAFNPRFSRMTITVQGDPEILEQIIKQANKLVDVIHASEHTGEDAVDTELALLKVKVTSANKPAVLKFIKKFEARLIDESQGVLIIEQAGSSDRLDELEKALKNYKLLEVVRTGKVCMVKGREET